MTMPFAAVHGSVVGTLEKSRDVSSSLAFEGKTGHVTDHPIRLRLTPISDIGPDWMVRLS